jgi:hypothetical protein
MDESTRIAQLEAEVASLRAEREQPQRNSRRTALRLGGAAVVGAAAAGLGRTGVVSALQGNFSEANVPAVLASSTSSNGVLATSVSNAAVSATSTNGSGVAATGRIGGQFTGSGWSMFLVPTPGHTAPPQANLASLRGYVDIDENGNIWACVADGTPGTWRKLVGAQTAGSFHAIPTARVYDSRWTAPTSPSGTPGLLSGGGSRVINVSDKRNLTTGNPEVPNAIPAGATAVAFNLTVTESTGSGFLAVEPGDASQFGGSTINYSPTLLALANASVAKLDGSRQLKVFCGGAGGTQFILDITGYYL